MSDKVEIKRCPLPDNGTCQNEGLIEELVAESQEARLLVQALRGLNSAFGSHNTELRKALEKQDEYWAVLQLTHPLLVGLQRDAIWAILHPGESVPVAALDLEDWASDEDTS